MKISAYVTFNGRCEEAFKFYEKHLGGKITFSMSHDQMPGAEQAPPEWAGKILHSTISFGDTMLMGSDTGAHPYVKPAGFAVNYEVPDPDDAERAFNALAENGEVQMPISQTFWAKKFGMLTDQFGVPWMVNCPSDFGPGDVKPDQR